MGIVGLNGVLVQLVAHLLLATHYQSDVIYFQNDVVLIHVIAVLH
jgi:hypothetical protein